MSTSLRKRSLYRGLLLIVLFFNIYFYHRECNEFLRFFTLMDLRINIYKPIYLVLYSLPIFG